VSVKLISSVYVLRQDVFIYRIRRISGRRKEEESSATAAGVMGKTLNLKPD